MSKWIGENLAWLIGLMISLVLNAALIGAMYASMKSDVTTNAIKIKALEEQRADETKWRVATLEKRADQSDNIISKINDKLDRLTTMVERIDQRTSGTLTLTK